MVGFITNDYPLDRYVCLSRHRMRYQHSPIQRIEEMLVSRVVVRDSADRAG